MFIDYCSLITVDDLSCNTIIVLQYNPHQPSNLPHCNTLRCIAIQFNHSSSLLFTIHKGVLQYNFFFLHTSILQYNPAHQASYCNTILTLQAFSCNTKPSQLHSQGCNTIFLLQYNPKPTTPFSCNTIAIQIFFLALSLAIQLQGCNTIFFFTIQLGSSPNPFLLHFLSRFFFKLPENHPKIHIYIFFSHTCYWKNTQKHKYTHFFFHFFQLLEE